MNFNFFKKAILMSLFLASNSYALDICNVWNTDFYSKTLQKISGQVCKNGKPLKKYEKYNKCGWYGGCSDEAKALVAVAILDKLVTKKEFGDLHYGKSEYDISELNVELGEIGLSNTEFLQEVDNDNLQNLSDKRGEALVDALNFQEEIMSIRVEEQELARGSVALKYDDKALINAKGPKLDSLRHKSSIAESRYFDAKKSYEESDHAGRIAAAQAKLDVSKKRKEVEQTLKKMHRDSLLSLKIKAKALCNLKGSVTQRDIGACYSVNKDFRSYLEKYKEKNQRISDQLKDLDNAFDDGEMLASILLNGNLKGQFPDLESTRITSNIDEVMEKKPLGDYIKRKAMEIACSVKEKENICTESALLNQKSLDDTVRSLKKIKKYRKQKLKLDGVKTK